MVDLSSSSLCASGEPLAARWPTVAPDRARWRALLRERLRGRPQPLLVCEDAATPAASLWTGARRWIEAFRAADLAPGDRLVLALPESTPFVQVLVAALWEGITLAPVPPGSDLPTLLVDLDARAAIATEPGVHTWVPEDVSGPVDAALTLRSAAEPATPDLCLLLRTSGTAGTPRWIGLSDANVFAVLDSHRLYLGLSENACVLSALPWHHAFGLVLELLPALLAGAEIVRAQCPRDAQALLAAFNAWAPTHFSAVPLTIRRLLEAGGRAHLHRLSGGLVGGAPIPPDVADGLRDSGLRVGYGQTEASPGIALGEPGHFVPGYLGHPVGCKTRTDAQGQLHFAGLNAHAGVWSAGHYRSLDPDRWVATGDLVAPAGHDPDALVFMGRLSDSFKLSNGRFVHAGRAEATLRATVPGLLDAVLCTLDGETLALALLMSHGAMPPHLPALRTALGRPGRRLSLVRVLTPATWVQHGKGTPDRSAIARALVAG